MPLSEEVTDHFEIIGSSPRSGNARVRRATVSTGIAFGAVGLILAGGGVAHAAPAGQIINSFGAYYQATPKFGVASASTTFKVPTVNCSQGSGAAFGLEANETSSSSVQVKTISEVFAMCTSGTPTYQFQVYADGTDFLENGVAPGDTVVASYYLSSQGTESIVHDLTSHYTWVADGNATSANTATFGVTEYGSPLAAFTSVPFSKAQLNGDYLGFADPSRYKYEVAGYAVTASATSIPADGDSFKVTSS